MEIDRECPMCFGTKKYFIGSRYKTCNICNEDGLVTQEMYNNYCQEEYDE